MAKLNERRRTNGKPFKVVVNDALRDGLNCKQLAPTLPRFHVEARSLGLRAGLTYDNIGELLETIEHSR